ncbi:uncharacterized protein [Battus philenor]|uniref:uncharacterized protein n=1 Tax=Battus philenor TaxID=42288 RepID=UPI0035D07B80
MSTNRHLYFKTEASQCQAHVSFDCNTVFLNSVCNVYDVPDARSVDNSRTERLRPDVCTKGRPILDIEIFGYRGTGLLDTAAKRSVVGSMLYSLLLKLGQPMRSSVMTVKLADGVVRDVTVRLVDVVVMLAGASIPITFVIFPDAVNNETLLGIDFIRKAGLVIDIFNETWFTADQPQVIHPLRCEKSRNFIGCASADMLRSDEGMMRSPPERASLAQTLQEYEDIFREGGGPTSFAEHRIDTGTHPPIAVPPYRLTPAKKEVMEAEINKMLTEGVIEEWGVAARRVSDRVRQPPSDFGGTKLLNHRA